MPVPLHGRRLLAVIPHPDDEAYAFAGLLALAAAAGATVDLLCATRGERGDNHLPDPAAPLAAIRTAELQTSCATLGIRPPSFLDLPDAGLLALDPLHLQRSIADHLRATDPHVVLSLGPDGAYGHTDHLALTAALTAALGTAIDSRSATPRLLHALFPPDLFLPQWRRMTQGPNAQAVDPAAPSLGVPLARADFQIDIRPVRRRKLAAIAAHRSQLPDGTPHSLFPPGLVDALLDVERFRLAAAPPSPPDSRPHHGAAPRQDTVGSLDRLFAGLPD